MSRNTRRARVSELVDELSVGAALRLRCKRDDIHSTVQAVVEYLISEYPSQDLYIPASLTPPKYPVEEIKKAAGSGRSIRSICKRFRISRKTFYRVLGEPEPPA